MKLTTSSSTCPYKLSRSQSPRQRQRKTVRTSHLAGHLRPSASQELEIRTWSHVVPVSDCERPCKFPESFSKHTLASVKRLKHIYGGITWVLSLCRQTPFYNENPEDMYKNIVDSPVPFVPRLSPAAMVRFGL